MGADTHCSTLYAAAAPGPMCASLASSRQKMPHSSACCLPSGVGAAAAAALAGRLPVPLPAAEVNVLRL